jgi:DNA-binding MarR family transcriptional regulator
MFAVDQSNCVNCLPSTFPANWPRSHFPVEAGGSRCRGGDGGIVEVRVTEDAILEFVGKAFRSVWHMELLLVLYQEPRHAWQVDALARELRASISVVSQSLDALIAAGLVAVVNDEACCFRPNSAELAELADGLIDLYNRKPRTVLRTIFAERRDRIQTFADAFRLRKRDDDH